MALTVLFLFILYLCVTSTLPIKNTEQGQTKVDVHDSGLVLSDKLILLDAYIRPLIRSKRHSVTDGKCPRGRVRCKTECRTIEKCKKFESGDYDYDE